MDKLFSNEFLAELSQDLDVSSLEPYLHTGIGAKTDAKLRLDLMTYLPDDILVKVDRMSMAHSLEIRSPLLDDKVVEFMSRLPRDLKYGYKSSKILLRKLARDYLPDRILHRPKQGFAVPLASWLQGELQDWMGDVLLSRQCVQRGLFRPEIVKNLISDHVSQKRDYSQQLWAMLTLEYWLQNNA